MNLFRVLLAAMGICLCLAHCQVSKSGNRPSPGAPPSKSPELPAPHLETLKRLLPQNYKITGTRQVGTEYEVATNSTLGKLRVWLDAQGFPLEMIEETSFGALPAPVKDKIPREKSQGALERHWLVLYEIEFEPPDGGEEEIFYDGWGRERFRMQDSENDREVILQPDDLTSSIKRGVAPYLNGAIPSRTKKETEWGRELIEVAWRNEKGWNEIKLLPSGEVLFWELPHSHAVPAEIGNQAQDEPPELLLLSVYCLGEGQDLTCWLADGSPFPRPSTE